jgi:hypothetical protein
MKTGPDPYSSPLYRKELQTGWAFGVHRSKCEELLASPINGSAGNRPEVTPGGRRHTEGAATAARARRAAGARRARNSEMWSVV